MRWLGLALVLLPLLWLGPAGLTSMGHDMTLLGLPILDNFWQMGQAGRLLSWNPSLFSGIPMIAALQGSLFYPLYLVFCCVRPTAAIAFFFFAHQALAWLGAYGYLRQLRFSRLAALVGGLTYAYSGARLYLSINLAYYGVLTFAPWILWGVERLQRRPGRRPVAGLAVVISLSALTAGIQLIALFAGTIIVYAAWLARRNPARMLGAYAAVGLLALGLCAAMWLPLSEVAQQGLMRGARFRFDQVAVNSLEWFSLPLLVYPDFLGPTEEVTARTGLHAHEHTYVLGPATLWLTFMAVRWGRRARRSRLVILGSSVLLLGLLALGRHNPVYPWLLQVVPGLSNFRVPVRYLATLGMFSMLATASGIEACERLTRLRRRLDWRWWGAPLVLLYGTYLVWGRPAWLPGHLLLLATLACLGCMVASPRLPKVAVLGAVVANGLSILWFVQGSFFVSPEPLRAELKLLEQVKGLIPGPGPKVLYAINPESPGMVGLANLSGLTPMVPGRYLDLLCLALRGSLPQGREAQDLLYQNFHPMLLLGSTTPSELQARAAFRVLCAQVVITPQAVTPLQGTWPHLWVAPRAEAGTVLDRGASLDPAQVVLLEGPPPTPAPAFQAGQPQLKRYAADELVVDLGGASGWLTLADQDYPGWSAQVDGQVRPILRSYGALRSVAIYPGDKELVMRYRSRYLQAGMLVSGLTLAVVLGLWATGVAAGTKD